MVVSTALFRKRLQISIYLTNCMWCELPPGAPTARTEAVHFFHVSQGVLLASVKLKDAPVNPGAMHLADASPALRQGRLLLMFLHTDFAATVIANSCSVVGRSNHKVHYIDLMLKGTNQNYSYT